MVSFNRKGSAETAEAEPQGGGVALAPVPVSAPTSAFPRVNLIPDEIAQEARVRRAKLVLGGSVLASLAAVGGLYMMASNDVNSAQENLDSATAQTATLAAETAKYADVPKVKADLTSAQAQQASAMAGEVRWSFLLNNLALTIPRGVALTSFKGSVSGAGSTTPSASGAQGSSSVLGTPGLGSIAYEGEAVNYANVSAFLEAMARQSGLTDPYSTQVARNQGAAAGISTGSVTLPGKGVTFSASATVNAKALSHRYDPKGN